MNSIKVGDLVTRITYPLNPHRTVIKQYYPTSCGQQTMIRCDVGRLFHAPTHEFVKINRRW